MTQDAVLVEALDRLQCGFDFRGDCWPRSRRALIRRLRRKCGSKRAWNRATICAAIAGIFAQRRPHIILRIGHADLAQETRNGPDQRNVAPAQSCRQHQRVVAVALRLLSHDDEEASFQPRFERGEIDGLTGCAFDLHVVKPDLGRIPGRPDVVSAFVDDAKAHVFQHRHALGERNRPAMAEDLQSRTRRRRRRPDGKNRRRADAPA